jgi:2-oxoglutarate dehydrogenase E2 component (dihydrolipoamide succinyltransferase)
VDGRSRRLADLASLNPLYVVLEFLPMTDILVPTLGESVTEATVGRWLKKAGEPVKKDEPLVELETDKVTIEAPAPEDGVISEILVEEGATVEIGALLGRIGSGAGAARPAAATAPAPEPEPEVKAAGARAAGAEPAPAPKPAPAAAKPAPAAATASATRAAEEPKVMPAARRAMAEAGLEAKDVEGTGKDGRIRKADVMRTLDASGSPVAREPAPAPPKPSAPPPAPVAEPRALAPREERVKMTRLRQTIARRLKEAQNTAAMLTTFNEADMSAVMAVRTKYKELFEKKHGIKLGFMSFFVKAVVQALRDIPTVNAEVDGDAVIYKNYYDIGIAVGTDRGLVVPVLRDADALSLGEIELAIADLGARARDGKLAIDDMQGATFTISNGGVYGSLMSTPILNAPQSGILGMHKIQERPVVVDGAVAVRPMMYLALTYDHRIVDGKEAVTFLVRVKELIEDPERLLLDL